MGAQYSPNYPAEYPTQDPPSYAPPPPKAAPKPHRVTKEHLVGVNLAEDKGIEAARLKDALKKAGNHLQQQGENITVIAAGGIIDVYLLERDHAVHDVLFFSYNLPQPRREALKAAFEVGEKAYKAPLTQALWNEAAMSEMGYDLERILTKASWTAGAVLMKTGGLTVVTCPAWYSFLTKVGRLGTPDERRYDLADAVEYVAAIANQQDKKTGRYEVIGREVMRSMCRKYQKAMPNEEQHNMVNEEHERRYNSTILGG